MPRFFLSEAQSDFTVETAPKHIVLEGEDAFHLSVSLRARPGDAVTVCSARGLELSCVVESLSGGKKNPLVTLQTLSVKESENEPPLSITLYQGMPKGKKVDSILQKCTELGVSRIVLVYSDFAVPRPDEEDKKLDRFTKIAKEAAMQCGRGKTVLVSFASSLDEVLEEMSSADTSFACYEKEEGRSLKSCIASARGAKSAAFFVGPEGGISPREISLLQEKNVPTVTLGKRILRTETAAGAVLSMFLYENEL